MDTKSVKPDKTRWGIYLLPNLFTTGCLFFGYYAIVMAMGGQYEKAAVAVFIAMILDGLDGRVARLTNTTSEFGVQYDSLADMVSFGLAPSLVMYEWSLHHLGKLGWAAAFIYTAGAALRLARFNTQVHVADKRYFQGLPSPAGAAIVAGMVWFAGDHQFSGMDLYAPAAVVTALTGLLMVSNLRYHSFKGIDLKGKIPFVMLLALVLIFVLIGMDPSQTLFFGFLIYAVSGVLITMGWMRKRRAERRTGAGPDSGPPDEHKPT
ncbi:MAG: CDP-diacylglycerol--serine O-phosphatidyltransferase [Gammaproteobacteria bacterium]|nr:CDP-diacylglycerol--serine O-phosphatidyltransferase [Gammaproteobacteria bacterium]